jgi:phospholipid transport system substrate-binding protein
MRRIPLFLAALATALMAGQAAHAQDKPKALKAASAERSPKPLPDGPQSFLQSMDGKLKPLLGKATSNEDKVVKTVNQMLDFPSLCKASLGKHWEGKTDAQRKDFSDTLHALIEKNVVRRLKDTKGHIITYESEDVEGKTATVVTIVADGAGPRAIQTEIIYKMERRGKAWVVVDMVTDGVSLVSNYRSQFNKIIANEGWDAMMKKMKDKLAEP